MLRASTNGKLPSRGTIPQRLASCRYETDLLPWPGLIYGSGQHPNRPGHKSEIAVLTQNSGRDIGRLPHSGVVNVEVFPDCGYLCLTILDSDVFAPAAWIMHVQKAKMEQQCRSDVIMRGHGSNARTERNCVQYSVMVFSV